MTDARDIAYRILLNVYREGSFSNLELKRTLVDQDYDSENFIRRMVYGVIEKSVYIDYYLDKLLRK